MLMKQFFHIHLVAFHLFFLKFLKVEVMPSIMFGNLTFCYFVKSLWHVFIKLISPIPVISMSFFPLVIEFFLWLGIWDCRFIPELFSSYFLCPPPTFTLSFLLDRSSLFSAYFTEGTRFKVI